MGGILCKHFIREQGHPEPKSELESSKEANAKSKSFIELVKPECLKTKKMKRERSRKSLSPPPEKNILEARKLTLEDWLLNSPARNSNKTERFNGGELYVFKHTSRRVHPSISSSSEIYHEAEASTSKPRDSFNCSLDFSKNSCSSMSRSQSGKLKKKVSFRLPEEADIIIY